MKFNNINDSSVFENYRQAQEYERKRIAAELHDTSLQTLAHLTHKIELALLYVDKDLSKAKLEINDVNRTLKDVIGEIRNTIFDLRPMTFDDIGFKEAVERYISEIDSRSDIRYSYDIEKLDIDDPNYSMELFRAIQECIKNCEKHSKAKNVFVKIYDKKDLFIEISDDGIGFNYDECFSKVDNHFGLSIVSDRVNVLGGRIDVHSDSKSGTRIIISIPHT